MLVLSWCANTALASQPVINNDADSYHQNVSQDQALANNRAPRDRMQKYHYYPEAYVYYSPGQHMYFYLSNNRWKMSATLPFSLHSELGNYVNIEADSDRPYNEFNKHKKLYKPKRRNKKHNRYGNHYGRDKQDNQNHQ